MKLKKLVERVSFIFVCVYLAKLVWGRGTLFFDMYRKEGSQYANDVATHYKCEEDHAYKHDAALTCTQAEMGANRWWRWRAVSRTWDATYSCIEYPCTDILRGLFESWISLAILAGFFGIIAFVGFAGLFSRLESGEKPWARPRIEEPRPYGQNGPAVMIGYDRVYDPSTVSVPLNEGLRSRVATWIPGRSGRESNLI